jgi:D-xylonolactonase
MVMNLSQLPTQRCLLGENPVWFGLTSEFLWTDIVNGTLYGYSTKTGLSRIVLSTKYQIGAFVLDTSDCILLFTEIGVMRANYGKDGFCLDEKVLFQVPFVPGERFNDAICDEKGRVLSGSKKENNTEGKLYCFEKDKSPKILLEHLEISNGMGFSPDGKIFYHVDSGPATITSYTYDVTTGSISHPRLLFKLENGFCPDGMTVDRDGTIWTCCWGIGNILKISPKGVLLDTIELPCKQCSSLCFGGDGFATLFITSATIGLIEDSSFDGLCYSIDTRGVGRNEYRAISHIGLEKVRYK